MIIHTVLGIDPGFTNCGYSIIDIRGDASGMVWRLRAAGLIQNPIQDFKHLDKSVLRYEQELTDMHEQYGITLLGIERFIGRQFTPKGKNPEAISFMVAVAASWGARRRVPTTLITAAQWKNGWNLKGKKGAIKRASTDDLYRACAAPAHLVDGCLQARYVGALACGTKPFERDTNKGAERMLRRIERICDPTLLRKIRNNGKL